MASPRHCLHLLSPAGRLSWFFEYSPIAFSFLHAAHLRPLGAPFLPCDGAEMAAAAGAVAAAAGGAVATLRPR